MRLLRTRNAAQTTTGGPGSKTEECSIKHKKSTISDLLTNARTALDLAVKLAPLIPVPFLSSIFDSAQIIVGVATVSRILAVVTYALLIGI